MWSWFMVVYITWTEFTKEQNRNRDSWLETYIYGCISKIKKIPRYQVMTHDYVSVTIFSQSLSFFVFDMQRRVFHQTETKVLLWSKCECVKRSTVVRSHGLSAVLSLLKKPLQRFLHRKRRRRSVHRRPEIRRRRSRSSRRSLIRFSLCCKKYGFCLHKWTIKY